MWTSERLGGLLRTGRDFLRSTSKARSGNVLVIFALSLLPVVSATGAAIDLSRAVLVRARLSHAIDAAGLAVGSSLGLSDEELNAVANDFFAANYPVHEIGVPGELQVTLTDSVVVLSATAQVDTTLVKLFGVDTITVASGAEITREQLGLEVALALDNTGSMNGGNKIGALRDAAGELIEILFGDEDYPDHLKVSLVPFVTSVNVRNEEFDWNWIDQNAEAEYHGVNFKPTLEGARVNHLDLFGAIPNAEWKGCVESRPAPYDIDDEAPASANADTLWVPYFWPDEPDDGPGDYHNKYMDDALEAWGGPDPLDPGSQEDKQQNWAKYYTGNNAAMDETPSTTSGPNKSCARPIVPLTNDKARLQQEVAAMRGWNNSGTNIAAGLAWAWRALSPGVPFTTGAPYEDPETRKALILLTDGENVIWGGWNSHNKSNYSAYGYLGDDRLGTSDKNAAKGVINGKVEALCESIKDKNIRLYTITFQVNSNALQDLFEACASEPDLYFNSPSNDALRTAFRAIAVDLSNLRLSQ